MQRYIGLDVHAASSTLAVISQAGKRLQTAVVETNGRVLVEAVRMVPGRKHLVLEEGTQSAWLYEILSPHVEEVVVAGVTRKRGQPITRLLETAPGRGPIRVARLLPIVVTPYRFRTRQQFWSYLIGDVVQC